MTQKGTPCRNYGSIIEESGDTTVYSATCKKHSSYDFKQHLVTRAQALEWDSIEYNYFKRLLEDGVIEIKKEDISALPRANYTHFLLLCAKYVKEFEFDWQTKRSQAALGNLWWQSRALSGPVYVSKKDIITLASTSDNPLTTLSYCLAAFPGVKYQQPTKEEWIRFLDYFFDSSASSEESGKLSLPHPFIVDKEFSERTAKLCEPFGNTFMKEFLLSGEFIKYVKEKKKSFYKSLKDQMDSVKGELVEICWHPDRYMDWCMDWEEKEWILSN